MPSVEALRTAITDSIRSTLKQEGLQRAREQWTAVNNLLSTEEWWPSVARAVRKEMDDFADMTARRMEELGTPHAIYIENNTNNTTNNVAPGKEFNTTIGHLDQMIGLAEGGSTVTHSTIKPTT